MFKITEGKGFHIQFKNGWVVSVQWGLGNYGPNYNVYPDLSSVAAYAASRETLNRDLGAKGAAEAEVAIWHKTMDNNSLPGGIELPPFPSRFPVASSQMQVLDYPMTPDELVQLLLEVATRDS